MLDRNDTNYNNFTSWLDRVCQNSIFPEDTVALCFNIYDNSNSYSIQLIATSSFNTDDSDWTCDEVFSTGDDKCEIPKDEKIDNWDNAEEYITEFVKQYLCDSSFSAKLKCYKALGIGFVDGDFFIVQL